MWMLAHPFTTEQPFNVIFSTFGALGSRSPSQIYFNTAMTWTLHLAANTFLDHISSYPWAKSLDPDQHHPTSAFFWIFVPLLPLAPI
jgi:hypothetical protein